MAIVADSNQAVPEARYPNARDGGLITQVCEAGEGFGEKEFRIGLDAAVGRRRLIV